MKHLKKLSVVLMLTTLFSVTFTSCIDNEVSPVVEAIYAAQADLIAAQANVQNAQAEFYMAQAAAENAAAAELAAITARYVGLTVTELREATAAADLAVEQARIAMLLAQAEFDQDIVQIAAAIRTAANIEAGVHAVDYATAMTQLATLKGEKLTVLQSIATKELYMKSVTVNAEMTWVEYLAGLQRDIAAKEASVASNEAYIVRANAYLDGDLADMKAALKVAEDAEIAKQVEIQALIDEKTIIDANIASGTGNYDTYISNYNTLVSQLNVLKGNLLSQQTTAKTLDSLTIPGLQTAIANYSGTTTTLTTAKNTAVGVVGTSTTGLKGDIATLIATLGTYGTAPVYFVGSMTNDVPRTGAAALTAQGKLWNADLALLKFEADFAALTASYNTAATDLVSATNTYNTTNWTLITTNAASAVTTAQGNLTTDIAYYNAKKAIFEAAPAGKTWFDKTSYLGTVNPYNEAYTNTKIGIHTDDATYTTSFSLVSGWVETTTGNNQWVPTGLATLMYVALPVGGTLYTGPVDTSATGTNTLVAPTAPYYVEVEQDDVFDTNVALFNKASELLGVEITAPFYTGTTTRTYAADFSAAPVTTYQALWNAQKLVNQIAYNQANAAAILADAQDEYDYQKALFETGLATRATLEAAVAVEVANVGKVTTGTPASGLLGQWEAKTNQLGNTAFTVAVAGNTVKTTATGTLGSDYYMVGTVKTLTAYAVKWNAELALANHLNTPVTGTGSYTEQLATAQAGLITANNMISEINILIVRKTADIAALTAEYDALVATPLYAAQQVRLLEIADEKAVLIAEKAVLTAEVSALAITIDFEGSASTGAIDAAIIAAQAIIDAAPAYIAQRNAAIALGNVSVANLTAEIVKLTADLVDLDAKIAVKAAEAAGYLALMNAALAS